MGLLVILMVVAVLSLVFVNVFRVVGENIKENKKTEVVLETEPQNNEVKIIHDTVYIDKPVYKSYDTPKNLQVKPKLIQPIIVEKVDTPSKKDTIN